MRIAAALLACALASVAVAATTSGEPEPEPVAGPFASLDAYCQALPKRTLHQMDSAQAGYTCAPPAPPDEGEPPACGDAHFAPTPGGLLVEARVVEVRAAADDRPLCLLAWRAAAGWYVHEDTLRSEAHNSRHYDYVVATRATAAPGGRGVVGRARLRSVTQTYDKRGDAHPDCDDALLLYGVGPSGKLSVIRYSVGLIERCDPIVFDGKNVPPSRWDEYEEDQLLPDGRLRLKRVGRHPDRKKPTVSEHVLRFP